MDYNAGLLMVAASSCTPKKNRKSSINEKILRQHKLDKKANKTGISWKELLSLPDEVRRATDSLMTKPDSRSQFVDDIAIFIASRWGSVV